ncbi:hypothetical protein TRVL_04753 [Trypanosoma vivax]|nr:hypothetical protein TRVL_04753 [Trypanosoma vivax]
MPRNTHCAAGPHLWNNCGGKQLRSYCFTFSAIAVVLLIYILLLPFLPSRTHTHANVYFHLVLCFHKYTQFLLSWRPQLLSACEYPAAAIPRAIHTLLLSNCFRHTSLSLCYFKPNTTHLCSASRAHC